MKISHAMSLLERSYANTLGMRVAQSHNKNGVQAQVLVDGTLVIPGTNEGSDWTRYNFLVRFFGRTKWHKGFHNHSQQVLAFAKALRPKRVIGHSLGAASAQIVGSTLGVPTICFASPRTSKLKTKFKSEHRVISFCRNDDPVTKSPGKWLGFRHLGRVYWIEDYFREPGGRHKVQDYRKVLNHPKNIGRFPTRW